MSLDEPWTFAEEIAGDLATKVNYVNNHVNNLEIKHSSLSIMKYVLDIYMWEFSVN